MRRGGGFRGGGFKGGGFKGGSFRPHRFASSSRRISRGASRRISHGPKFSSGPTFRPHRRSQPLFPRRHRPGSLWYNPRPRYYGPWYRRRRYYGSYGYYNRGPASLIGFIVFLFFLFIIIALISGSPGFSIVLVIVFLVIFLVARNSSQKYDTQTQNTGATGSSSPVTATQGSQYVQRPAPSFCPACGSATLANQAYCASCGVKL